MKIEKQNYTLIARQRVDKRAKFGSIEHAQSALQSKSSYETSGSMGKVDKNVSMSLRQLSANGRIGKVTKAPYAIITFGGKNKNHQVFVGAEMPPYCKIGGVATVMDDYKAMFNDDPDNRKVMIIPYYNGKIECSSQNGGRPTGKILVHTFPKGTKDGNGNDIGGQPFYTSEDLYNNTEADIIRKGKYKILEKVGSDETMAFGFNTDEPIGLYRVKGTNHFMVFTEATAAMPKPYTKREKIGAGKAKQTSYASSSGGISNGWEGEAYAHFNKAVVQLLPKIEHTYTDKGVQETTKFEPGTVVCSDSQTAYIPHYMAMAINDNDYYNDDIHPTYVAHNLGQGYISKSTYKEMYINLGATKEDLENIQNDPVYKEAALQGEVKEEEYFKKLFDDTNKGLKLADANGDVSGTMVAIHYTKEGYIPVLTTVSEDYAESLVTNEAISPGLFPILKEMYAKKIFQGILNAANDPNLDPTRRNGLAGFSFAMFEVTDMDGKKSFITSKDLALKDLASNEEFKNAKDEQKNEMIDKAALVYDKQEKVADIHGYTNITRYTEAFSRYPKVVTDENWDEIKTAKAQNKLNFINRLKKDGETNSLLLTGLNGREVKEVGALDFDTITAGLDKSKSPVEQLKECTLTVSWGRGDLQKGLDTTMLAWAKSARHDKNAFLILGGELPKDDNEDAKKIIQVIDMLSKEFKGRFVFLDGFAPGYALSMAADVASFPSRFAPCELTDLEAMHFGVTPIVTNCQGLKQKNFDPELGDTQDPTSFKTLHEFFMSHENLVKHDEEMEKAVEWLETKKDDFKAFLDGDKTKGFSYKEDITSEEVYQGRDAILSAYDSEKNLTTDEAKQKDTIRELLRASYDLKTSGFKDKYNTMQNTALQQAKNRYDNKDVSKDYAADIIKDIKKSKDYEDLMRASRDFIVNSELAMGFIRSKHVMANDASKKLLCTNALSLNTSLKGNGALHPSGKSTQELYRELHINGNSQKSGIKVFQGEHKIHIDVTKPTDDAKGLFGKIKNWWSGLSKTAKWGIGIGSGVATAAAIGGGIFAAVKVQQNKLAALEAQEAAEEAAMLDEDDDAMIEE